MAIVDFDLTPEQCLARIRERDETRRRRARERFGRNDVLVVGYSPHPYLMDFIGRDRGAVNQRIEFIRRELQTELMLALEYMYAHRMIDVSDKDFTGDRRIRHLPPG